jgi:hypothetical protein
MTETYGVLEGRERELEERGPQSNWTSARKWRRTIDDAGRMHRPPATTVPAAVPLVLTLVVLSAFLPEELSFYVVGLRLTATRFLLLLLIPALATQLGNKLIARQYRFVLSDALVLVTGFWMIYSAAAIDGLLPALNHAGPTVLEFCISYFATRVFLNEHGQALSFAALLCRAIAVVALLALLDPISDRYFVHYIARELTGYSTLINDHDDHRFGLLRAAGPLEHPILLGYACTVGFLIGVSVRFRSRAVATIACGFGVVIAFSSAPFEATLLGLALLIYSKMTIRIPLRWIALIGLGAAGVGVAFLLSNSPVGFIASHMIYDPVSGFYRIMTWQQVIEALSRSPLFGLGFGPWPRSINHSIDSLWLITAVVSGVPGAALLALSMIGTVSHPTRGANVQLTEAETKLATTLGILIFLTMFVAFTVHFWGTDWILLGLLMGLRAHLGELGNIRGPLSPVGATVGGRMTVRMEPERRL